jgi:hypothetical protein
LGVRVGQLRTWRLEFEKEAVTGIAKPDRAAAEDCGFNRSMQHTIA